MQRQLLKNMVMWTLGFALGYYIGFYKHPYETCREIYESPEDTSECVWLLENNG